MGESRQQRIRLLVRRNILRTAAPLLLERLANVVGDEVSPAALVSEANGLRESFRLGYQGAIEKHAFAYRRFFRSHESRQVFLLAARLAGQITERVYLLTRAETISVAVILSSPGLLANAESVIEIDRDSLSLLSLDGTEGILIDHNPDDSNETYEFVVWGSRWPLITLACVHS